MRDLTLLAMVGIVDPPRAEAKAAIEQCHRAGIEVRMITGDHAVTAAAIGTELGIKGKALTGAEFAAMTDERAVRPSSTTSASSPGWRPRTRSGWSARSRSSRNIVAMTGDGVNDAPALKKADIGVAMGITGTEVSKDAAVMILTDDNFATIVRAVEYGRELYDNLAKYIRFQMAALVGVHRHVPRRRHLLHRRRHPVLAARGAVDQLRRAGAARAGARVRPAPRGPDGQAAATARRAGALRACSGASTSCSASLIADRHAVGTRRVRGPGERDRRHVDGRDRLLADERRARARRPQRNQTALDRDSISGRRQLHALRIGARCSPSCATELGLSQRILGTTSLTGGQWLVCIGLAAGLLLVGELVKLWIRRSGRGAAG